MFALRRARGGKTISPLAFTKTYATAAAAGLAITLVPVLMGYFIRGNVLPEHKKQSTAADGDADNAEPPASSVKVMIVIALGLIASAYYPTSKLGSDSFTALDEGDLMYMPTTYCPGISMTREVAATNQ